MKKVILLLLMALLSQVTYASGQYITNLEIKRIRAVGDYPGSTYDNTIELWFTVPLTFEAKMLCTKTYRVYVNSSNQHLISAAYMAKATNSKVGVYINDQLPIRNGSCEISYIEVL